MRRLLALLPAVSLAVVLTPGVAAAATYSEGGYRCTKVGTSGNDRLTGTSGKDVICGLGGNDVLYGYGSDDVLDGGSGSDTLYGSSGNDRIYGGPGNDAVIADTGNDTVFGGIGDDRESGGAGSDVMYGSDGSDTLSGGAGTDKEYGGAGNDTIRGGDDNDLVVGEPGNDDISGDGGSDTIEGGSGTNWCTVGATDTQHACVYDKTPPSMWWSNAAPDPVDVTTADRAVVVRMHLLDDTGVASVQAGFQDFTTGAIGPSVGVPQLISGTVRDGIWEARGIAHRYSEPGAFELNVMVRDRVGRWRDASADAAITVKDATPDRTNAVVRGVSMSRSTVDVRTAAGSITVNAHVTDDASGVEVGDIQACLYSPGGDGTYVQHACPNMERYSGTSRDGYWHATMTIPKGSVGGDWNVGVWVSDQVHQGTQRYWVGPDVYRAYTTAWGGPDPSWFELSGGRFSVLGTTDSTAAALTALRTDRTTIDTLPSAQTVHLYARAKDAAGEGVTEVGGDVTSETNDMNGPSFPPVDGVLYQGTLVDGWWQLTITFPQGTPPGRYPVAQVWVADKSHWRSYAPASSPFASENGQLAFPSGSVTTTSGAAWDGVITVVQNSG